MCDVDINLKQGVGHYKHNLGVHYWPKNNKFGQNLGLRI